MSLWGGRFKDGSSAMFRTVNDSLPFDQVLATQDITGSIAWSRAIALAGVLTTEEQQQLEQALLGLRAQAEKGQLDFANSNAEDIHSFVEAALIDQLGDVARKLHTGRSRNDQVATDLRLWTREHVSLLKADIKQVLNALLSLAEANQSTILPGYTHLQRAQPIRFPHWCLAYVEMFKRDLSRLHDLSERMNQCPLGSGALAGTTYGVDRYVIAAELGFDGPCLNSLDAVSDRDYVLELLFCASTSMMHLSRMAEDMIFFNSGESGFIQLGDQVTSGSSLMPQKKNPDALELIRGKCGRVFGSLQALLVTMKGLPLAYNKDMQEDKEPMLSTLDTVTSSLEVLTQMIRNTKFKPEGMKKALTDGFITATDLADYLARKGMPFRQAHEITGKLVAYAEKKRKELLKLNISEMQMFSSLFEEDVFEFITIEGSISSRKSYGGTARENVLKMIDEAKKEVANW